MRSLFLLLFFCRNFRERDLKLFFNPHQTNAASENRIYRNDVTVPRIEQLYQLEASQASDHLWGLFGEWRYLFPAYVEASLASVRTGQMDAFASIVFRHVQLLSALIREVPQDEGPCNRLVCYLYAQIHVAEKVVGSDSALLEPIYRAVEDITPPYDNYAQMEGELLAIYESSPGAPLEGLIDDLQNGYWYP